MANSLPSEAPGKPHDPESEQWSRLEQLVAGLRDEVHFLRHAYAVTHSKQKVKWTPEPLPRPGIKPKMKRAVLAPAQLSLLQQHLQATQPEED